MRILWSLALMACAVIAAAFFDDEAADELAIEALEHFGGER